MASRASRWNGDTPLTTFHGGTKSAALRAIKEAQQRRRDAERYADWVRRGKPPSPSLSPRRDRLRPRAQRGSDQLRERLFEAQRGLCGICGALIYAASEGTIDHVLPRALGGKNAGNVVLAHARCNNAKAARPPTRRELETLALVNERLASMACSSMVEPSAHNGFDAGSIPAGPTSDSDTRRMAETEGLGSQTE